MSIDLGNYTREGSPRLSLKEREVRWGKIRSAMREQGLDALLVHGDSGKWDQKSSNMRYVGHIGGNGEDGYLLFPLEGEPTAFVFSGGAMLNMWQELQNWVQDIRNAPGNRWSHFIDIAIREKELTHANIGVVGLNGYQESEGTVSFITLTNLKNKLPNVEFSDATLLVENLRLYKSEEEISFVEEATKIGDHAIQVMREACQPGINEYQAYAETMGALIAAGSEQPVTFFWDAGKSVNHGQRFAGRKKLEAGDVIVNEISPRYFGYWAHFQAPVAVGKAPKKYQQLMDIALESYGNAFSTLRPGLHLRDVAEAFEKPIVKAGATSMHVYAHGTGGRGSEFPVIFPPSRRIGMNDAALAAFERVMNIEVKEGMILAFEPHVTFDRVHGLHVGDPVVVTAHGCRRLSTINLSNWVSPSH